MVRTVGLRFRQAGKIFYYDAGDLDLQVSNYVVVETAYGLAVGRVVIAPDQVVANEGSTSDLKPVLRVATSEDIDAMEAARQRADEATLLAKQKVSEQDLDMSIASGEFDLEGSQFTAYFTANNRVDFRQLVRDLSRELDTRVQLLQVGDRDRAKLVDGFDVCGERLCCSSWMTNFPSVSIRMAKEQDLPLNPQKISGVCGRLYCCLTFEYEDYKALRGTLPKVGSFLSTPAGEARVSSIDFNREVVKLWLTEARELVEVAAIDFQLQHGVTVRPMELVRKIEGPLRTITEDSDGSGSGRASSDPRPQRGQPRREGPRAGRSEVHPAASAPAPPPRQQRRQPDGPRAPQLTPGPSSPPQQQAAPNEAAQGKRRRRRRRGRGGGGEPGPAG